MMKKLLILGAVLLLIQGCSLKVMQMDPMPNINIEDSESSMALVLGDKIKNIYHIPENKGIKKADVEGWRVSLENGFRNAFGDYYQLSDTPDKADLVLILKRADIGFAPTSMATNANVVSVESHITFNSQLKNSDGKTIERLAKTATSKGSVASPDHITGNVKSAVESMFELIAEDMFTN